MIALLRQGVLVGGLLLLLPMSMAAQADVQAALVAALRATPAVGIVVDVTSGRTIAEVGAATTRSTPGSLLKPLFLASALKQGYVLPQTSVFCRRRLLVQDAHRTWNLACTHPQSHTAFTAQEALAYSCNRYFADLADRIPPGEAGAILRHYRLGHIADSQDTQQKELLILGVAGILVTPAQMAEAYRKLANELNQDASAQPVRAGLEDSVTYGMAHNAAMPGRKVFGKTGTASDTENGHSHGWFAGISPIHHLATVIVIYVPQGNGADAALLAQRFFVATSAAP